MVGLRGLLKPNAKLDLLYDGQEHEFEVGPFHEACDGKGTTITVAKTENDYVFGMFTTVPW